MYCPEADRGGGEGAGAQAEVDDGVLPAPDVHGEEGGGGSGSRPRTEAAMDAATRMRGWR